MARHRNNGNRGFLITLVALLSLILIILSFMTVWLRQMKGELPLQNGGAPVLQTQPTTEAPTEAPTEPPTTQPPTEPPVTLLSSATVSATGDILMHMPCVQAGETSSGYDFSPFFTYVSEYIGKADYAVANLETTLCGTDNGYKYSGYPSFNCPDEIVTALDTAGFDMLLTANNHCYDTNTKGYHRTQKVVSEAGLSYTGSIPDEDTPNYLVEDVNGIKLGMICYTYETSNDPNVVAPNGITMKDADEALINSFNVEELDTFYQRIGGQIAEMKQAGAEALVLYIHWGEEYQLKENNTQNTIAQKMCDLGIDVIVGGHPHVIQPMELLTSTEDESHKTLCLYSTGNALSNQRRENMNLNTGHTEDGIIFSFTFCKYSDGTVRVEGAEVLPTWVNKYTSGSGKTIYEIYPLDTQVENWKEKMDLSDKTEERCRASYERTMKIVGEGLEQINSYLETLPKVADEA